MIPTKDMTPHVPVGVDEIIEQVHEAYEIGITMVHLHARDGDGTPTYKKEIYGKTMEGVRKHCPDLVICLSLSGRLFNTFEKRSEALELMPDLGSLTLSSLNFPQQASVNTPGMVQSLAKRMLELGVKPELEVFDLGMINYARYLSKKELLKPPYYFNLLFGNIAGMQATPSQMGAALNELPKESYWSFAGIGDQQLKANAIAIALGGGVRVGIEDNIFLDRARQVQATNAQLIRRIHQLAEIHERPVMQSSTLGNLGFYNPNRS